jgi:hypothetical protein
MPYTYTYENEKITPNSQLSKQQLDILNNLDSSNRNKHTCYTLKIPNDMTQTDVHYIKIEIELRRPNLTVYQRQNVLLIVVDQ